MDNDSLSDVVMMLAGLLLIVVAAVAMLAAEGAFPVPLATIGIVFVAIGARRRHLHS